MNISRPGSPSHASQWNGSKPPLLRFLEHCHAEFASETSGSVADYIPELGKADPDRFGISLATMDGHVYEVGDTRIPFTIQSITCLSNHARNCASRSSGFTIKPL